MRVVTFAQARVASSLRVGTARYSTFRTQTSPDRPQCTRISDRSFILVTGSNAATFLNGIISNRVPAAGGIFSALLHAQGRVLYDIFIFPYAAEDTKESGYLIEYDPRPSQAPPLLDLLQRYILRSRVKVRDVGPEWTVWAAWGKKSSDNEVSSPERCWHWAPSQVIEPNWIATRSPWLGMHPLQILDRRVDGMGLREAVRHGDLPSFLNDYDQVDEEAYLLHRFRHGVPEGNTEIIPMQAFPMESNLDLMGAIDFRKGCYVGQELTVRTYHTGLVRKRVFPVRIQTESGDFTTGKRQATQDASRTLIGANISPFALSSRPLRSRTAGKLLNYLSNEGLALLRMEHFDASRTEQIRLRIDPPADFADHSGGWHVETWWPMTWPHRPQASTEGGGPANVAPSS